MNSAAGGARWVMLENLLRQFLGLGVYLVLARLLGPEAFGLLALAGVAVTFSSIFIEGALGDAVVQRKQAEAGFLDTVFATAGGAGMLIATLLYLAADPVAALLGQDQLAALLRWLAPVIAINALCVVQQAILQRRFAYRAFAIRTGVGLLAGGGTGIALALSGYGVMSLVGQQLVQAAVNFLVLWGVSEWRPGVRVSRGHLKALLRFAAPLVAGNFLNFFNRKGDDLLIGVFLGPVALGYYALAYQVLLVLEQLVSRGFDAVGLSTFSRLQHDVQALQKTFLRFTRLAGMAAVPVFVGAAAVAPVAWPLLFGDAWQSAVPVFQWLTLAGLLHAVFHFNHAMFKACGKPGMSLVVAAINAIANVVIFLLVVRHGVVAVAAAYAIRAWLFAPVGLILLRRVTGLSIWHYVRQHSTPIFAGLVMAAVVFWISQVNQSWPGLIGQIAGGAAVYLVLVGCFMFDRPEHILRAIKKPA